MASLQTRGHVRAQRLLTVSHWFTSLDRLRL
nr:MAG TPA: hypothetical protein [Caudoviricetes sp.]